MRQYFNDTIKVTGTLNIKKFKGDVLVSDIDVNNLVVTSGKNHIAAKMVGYVGSSAAPMSHMAVGTLGATPVVGNTALGSEAGRVVLNSVTVTDAVVTYVATFPAGTATGNLVEAGIFNSSSNGTMLCRTTFPVIIKDPAESIVITWNVAVG